MRWWGMGRAEVGLWELPEGWETARLGDLVEVKTGFACAKKNLVSQGVPHLRPFNVGTNGELDLSEVYQIPEDYRANMGDYALEPGHILFNNTNSVELVGKTAVVREPLRTAFSNHITRLTVNDISRVDPAWVALALRQLWATGYFAANCNRWIGQAGFNTRMLSEVEIPLPDPEEQRRIVARIEALFAELAEARRLHEAASEDVDALMDATLHHVFLSLVEECGLEPLGRYKPFITSGPRHWAKYAHPEGAGPLFLRVGNVGYASLELEDIEYLELPVDAGEKRARVQAGDVLVTITGTIGRCAVVPPDLPRAYINQHTALVRLEPGTVLPRYLMWFVLSPVGSGQATSAAYGQTKPGLNLTQLRQLQLPLPAPFEQSHIVAYLDRIQAQVIALKQAQEATEAELERLERAILARAFRGEL